MPSRVTEYTELSACTDDDVLYIVDAPGGVPASKKITAANLRTSLLTAIPVDTTLAETDDIYFEDTPGGTPTPKKITLANLRKSLQRVADVKSYGAVGDGVADDTDAVEAAIAADKGTVFFPPGTYKVTNTIACNPNSRLTGSNVVVDGSAVVGNTLAFTGSTSALPAQSGNEVAGNRTWSFVSAHGLAVGDAIRVDNTTDYSYSAYRTYYKKREFFFVREVPSSTTIETSGGAYLDWTAAEATWVKIAANSPSIEGDITVIGNSGNASSTYCIDFTDVLFTHVRGVTTRSAYDAGIAFTSCYGGVVDSVTAIKETDDVHGGSYGVVFRGCQHMRVVDSYLFGKRHGVAIGGAGVNIGIVVDNCTLDSDTSYSGDLHGNCLYCAYRNCFLNNGCDMGGNYNEISGCDIRGFGCHEGEPTGWSWRFLNNRINTLTASYLPLRFEGGANCNQGGVFIVDNLTVLPTCPDGLIKLTSTATDDIAMRVAISNVHQLDCAQTGAAAIYAAWSNTAAQPTTINIANCSFAGNVEIIYVKNVRVSNVHILDTTDYGLGVSGATVENVFISNCEINSTSHGIIAYATGTISIENILYRGLASTGYAIQAIGFVGDYAELVRISNITVLPAHGYGVKAQYATLVDIDQLKLITESTTYTVWTPNTDELRLSRFHFVTTSKAVLAATKIYLDATSAVTPVERIEASVGSVCRNIAGSAGTTMYIKETGDALTGWVAVATLGQGAPTAVADGNTAITAAELLTKILTMASSTAPRAPTVPTGAAIDGVLGVGESIDWSFLNTGDQTVTITQATGHTLVGGMALAAGTQGQFRTRCTATNTAITYRLS